MRVDGDDETRVVWGDWQKGVGENAINFIHTGIKFF